MHGDDIVMILVIDLDFGFGSQRKLLGVVSTYLKVVYTRMPRAPNAPLDVRVDRGLGVGVGVGGAVGVGVRCRCIGLDWVGVGVGVAGAVGVWGRCIGWDCGSGSGIGDWLLVQCTCELMERIQRMA